MGIGPTRGHASLQNYSALYFLLPLERPYRLLRVISGLVPHHLIKGSLPEKIALIEDQTFNVLLGYSLLQLQSGKNERWLV